MSWEPPADRGAEGVATALRRLGARQWQVDLVAPVVAAAFAAAAASTAAEG